MQKLSITAYQYIWSAIHQPHLPNHSGLTVLNLFIDAGKALQKGLFEEFAKTRNPYNAETILVEMQNLLLSNPELEQKVQAAIQAGKDDPLKPLPDTRLSADEETTFSTAGNFNRDLLIGVGCILAGVLLTALTSGQRLFYGLIVVGFIQVVRVLTR
jgi:hypothetical protein